MLKQSTSALTSSVPGMSLDFWLHLPEDNASFCFLYPVFPLATPSSVFRALSPAPLESFLPSRLAFLLFPPCSWERSIRCHRGASPPDSGGSGTHRQPQVWRDSTVQHSTVRCSEVQFSTVQHSTKPWTAPIVNCRCGGTHAVH